jgi:iron complex outermembrane receptor protein
MLAAWARYRVNITHNLIVTAGIRGELIDYDYTNHMVSGNTRDDGTECGFGGCLYTRPASRSDDFVNFSPDLGLNWLVGEKYTLYARVARGFRAPQATELYRLQRGQEVADLDSETLDTFELGIRSADRATAWDLALFAMRKDNFIFRDADGFNVSDGKTDHLGVEASVDWQFSRRWRLGANASWARHEYAFDRPASGISKGNVVDTAPEWLAGARLRFIPNETLSAELEWVHMNDYYLDPANAHRYEGHDLLHLRTFYTVAGTGHGIGLRITNLLDDYYAERADFAFGSYQYFPSAGRRFFLEWRYAP